MQLQTVNNCSPDTLTLLHDNTWLVFVPPKYFAKTETKMTIKIKVETK